MRSRLSVILVAFLILVMFGTTRVAAYPAIVVYDHEFDKQMRWSRGHLVPGNKTSSFTQDDDFVYAYLQAAFYSANFTWQWFDPDGQLYRNFTQQATCESTPCAFVSAISLRDTEAAVRLGTWRLDFLADGFRLYSDSFSVTPIITESDSWNFTIFTSSPPRVHVGLTVTIHPDNLTWTSYKMWMPYAANLSAYEPFSHRTLTVTTFINSTIVLVNFGRPQSDGYEFVLAFDLTYGLNDLNGWIARPSQNFALTWQEFPWERFNDVHPIPQSFEITLPEKSVLVDTVGYNTIALGHKVLQEANVSIFFNTTVIDQRFGWSLIYHDLHYSALKPSASSDFINLASQQAIPFLPITLGGMSVWSAVMSVFVLTASEFLSPMYARTGIVLNRKRLRIAGLILVAIFGLTMVYQLVIYPSFVLGPSH